MSERLDTLQQYVSDMLAVERHMLEPVEKQARDDRVARHPSAQRLITKLETHIRSHIRGLEEHLSNLGGDTGSPIKSAATAVLGAAAGVIDKVRTNPVSKDPRDDYTALNLAAVSYTMLHTTGLALSDQRTADLAAQYLKDYTPLITEINEIIPEVVVVELRDETEFAIQGITKQAIRGSQEAWSNEHVHAGHMHDWD